MKTKELNIKEATKKYNEIMNDMCYEYNTIGTKFSENTENWNLRDMVSECQYILDCCYEEGNSNNVGQYPDYWQYTESDIMDRKRFNYVQCHNENEKELHKEWLSKTRRLKKFISKYSPHVKNMKCSMGHCSSWDN